MVDLTKKQIDKFNIKSCPFCDVKAELFQDMDETWSVKCPNIGCLVGPITLSFSYPQGAVLAWNTRGKVDIKPARSKQ